MKVYVGQNESHNIEGADYWLDCLHDIAVHITPGYRLVLETENYMISLGADGVDLTEKVILGPTMMNGWKNVFMSLILKQEREQNKQYLQIWRHHFLLGKDCYL